MASSGDRFRRQPSPGGTKGASAQPGGGVATPRQGVPANPVSRTEQAGLAHEGLRGEPTANLDQGGYSRPSRRRHARGDGPADMQEVGGVGADWTAGTANFMESRVEMVLETN